MQWLGETWRRLFFLVRRGRADDEIAAQIEFHLEMETQANLEAGMDAGAARDAAMRKVGNALSLRERSHDEWGWAWLEGVAADIRLAGRIFRRSPGFVAVAVASLALGIGLNVSIFTFVNDLFLKPFPGVQDSGRLVSLYLHTRGGAGDYDGLSFRDLEYYQQHARMFSGMAGITRWPMVVRADGSTEALQGELVTPGYFSVLGVEPVAGRLLHGDESAATGTDTVVVLSHRYWTRRFGADAAVVGRTIQVANAVCTIVGVAPAGFDGLTLGEEPPSFWVPVSTWRQTVPALRGDDFLASWGNRSFSAVGRLRPGASLAAAEGEMRLLDARLLHDYPERTKTWADLPGVGDTVSALLPALETRLSPGERREVVSALTWLSGAFVLILLVACFNLANLVLARTAARQRELAVRVSLGAPRGRVLRQLLTENLLLSLAGGAASLFVAQWSTSVLLRFGAAFGGPLAVEPGIDLRVLAFTAAAAVASAVAVTALPVRLVQDSTLNASIKRTAVGLARGNVNPHQVLTTAQIAVSIVLLIGAGLFVRTLRNAEAEDPTTRPDQLLLADVTLGPDRYAADDRRSTFYADLLDGLRAIPGVTAAAAVMIVPLGGRAGGTQIEMAPLQGGPPQRVNVAFNIVSPGHFATVGTPLVAGRGFTDRDGRNAPSVAIVNEEMGRRLFQGRSPIGERFVLKWPPAREVEVVGVVRDGRMRNYRAALRPTVYAPLSQVTPASMTIEVRGAGSAGDAARLVTEQVASLDRDLLVGRVRTAQGHLADALARERLNAFLMTLLAGVAAALGALGVFGVFSYAVTERTREIGIRLAVGGAPRAILLTIMGRVLWMMGAGLLVGAMAALGLARLVKGMLFGVEPADPLVWGGTMLLLSFIVLAAGYLPARRASRVDPVLALRQE